MSVIPAAPSSVKNARLIYGLRWTLVSVVFVLLALGFAKPIKLSGTDIGRHLKNGELFMTGGGIPATNLYSYTAPEFPVVNHHWASGVVFYLVKEWCGFSGLSLFYMVIMFITCALMFYLASRVGSYGGAITAFLLLLPLMLERTEVRPEGFSYLLCALFSLIIYLVKQRTISPYALLALPLIEALWVNLHIYFIIGIFIIGVHLLECWCHLYFFRRAARETGKKSIRRLFALKGTDEECLALTRWLASAMVLATVASCLNPSGLRGALEPLTIFSSYGYRIVENQSIFFLTRLLSLPVLSYFACCFVAVIALTISWIVLAMRRDEHISLATLLIVGTFTLMATLALRNFTLCGLYMTLVVSAGLNEIMAIKSTKVYLRPAILAGILLGLIPMFNFALVKARFFNPGIGLDQAASGPIDFFNRQGLTGPIFNNYDIGGLLIYGLYPRERVFVDNRPEAYPAEFFSELLIPMQEDDGLWRAADQRYGFNSIIFAYRDYTSWGQRFITSRVEDPAWVPVYVDQSVIILLKANETNRQIIDRFAIDRAMFRKAP